MTQPPHRLRSRDHVRRNHTPIRAGPAAPYDLTILTVLRDGRHLWFSNIVREGDYPERMTLAHCAVRKLYHDADLEHFIVIAGTSVERILPGVPRSSGQGR